VKITRRHHPLEGQVLEVVRGGQNQIVVRPPDGTPMRVPREWTDADGEAWRRSAEKIFTVDALRDLIHLVDALRGRPPEGGVNR
jgi:hypothetical protein